MQLKIKYLSPDIPAITSKDGDSGYDLRAAITNSLTIPSHSIVTVPTGICLEVCNYPSDDYLSVEIQIRPRSGQTKNGIIAQFGTVDSTYRGEIKINLMNFNDHPTEIQPLERIAQMVICPIYKPQIIAVDELSSTERADKGFGSSGRI